MKFSIYYHEINWGKINADLGNFDLFYNNNEMNYLRDMMTIVQVGSKL